MCMVRGQPCRRQTLGTKQPTAVCLLAASRPDQDCWRLLPRAPFCFPSAGEGWFGPQPPDSKTPTYLTRVRVGKVTTGEGARPSCAAAAV